MTKTENLLTTVSEECGEIIQAVSKFLRFGAQNHAPYEHTTNADALVTEYYQLRALIEELQEQGVLPLPTEKEQKKIMDGKIKKVLEFQDYSERIGMIEKTEESQPKKGKTPLNPQEAWFTDLDSTVITSKVDYPAYSGLVPVAQKNGKHTSYMTAKAYTELGKITKMLTCVPVTTRCLESYSNIYIGSQFDHALVENGAILAIREDTNHGTQWNIDREWLKDSEDIVTEDRKAFVKARGLLRMYGYVEKWGGVNFTLDFIQDKNIRCTASPKEMEKILIEEGCGDALLIVKGSSSICCTYRKLSKGQAVNRYCKRFGVHPLISSGDREEDNSMFSRTLYSVGTQGTEAKIKVQKRPSVEECEDIVHNVLDIATTVTQSPASVRQSITPD